MAMEITEIRLLAVLGLLAVGVITTVGALVFSALAAGAMHAGLAVGGALARLWDHAGRHGHTAARASLPEGSRRFASEDHALLGRLAWWRPRC
jgi:hypothetical protein